MKTILRVLVLALLSVGFTSISMAQDNTERDALYNKFLACYKEKTDEAKVRACQVIGKEFLQKFGEDKDNQEVIDFVKKQVVRQDAYIKAIQSDARYARFNNALNSKNWAEVFAGGKAILAVEPDELDIMIIMASVGFDRASIDKVDTYNADTIFYAKEVIKRVEGGAKSETWGPGSWSYITKAYPDGKSNLLGWMNYTIGFIMNTRMGTTNAQMMTDSLQFFYKAQQYKSEVAQFPDLYIFFAKHYLLVKYNTAVDEYDVIKAKNNNVETDETRTKFGELKAIAERAADSFARALKIVNANPAKFPNKQFKDYLTTNLNNTYKVRFGDKAATPVAVNAFVADTANKPFVSADTPIVPVIEVVATPPTTTPPTTMPNTKPTTLPANTKPTMTTPATKPATTPTTPATKPATKTTTKPATTKKPVVKKKGTR